MASTDNGGQVITFRYQQEGTAEGFNKLLSGVIPTGIIEGGKITKVSDTSVTLDEMQMVIGDGNVVVHVQTTEPATVEVSKVYPYIVASFNWSNLVNNYVTFESVASNMIPSANSLILGKCEYVGSTLSENFDYSRKTWSSTYLNNDFMFENLYRTKSPNFNVMCTDNPTAGELSFYVGKGKAVVNGKEVVIDLDTKITLSDSDTTSNKYFIRTINYSRIDLAVLLNNGDVEYIMGVDSSDPTPPRFPCNALPLATFTFDSGTIQNIKGSSITRIYNNNFIGLGSTVGKSVGGNNVNQHTLYI